MRAALLRRPVDLARCTIQPAPELIRLPERTPVREGSRAQPQPSLRQPNVAPKLPWSIEIPAAASPKFLSSPLQPPIPRNPLIPLLK
jgi:hypothetical protein